MNPLTANQKIVYQAFLINGASRPHDIALYLGYTESAFIYSAIKALVKKGYLKKIEGGRGKMVFYQTV